MPKSRGRSPQSYVHDPVVAERRARLVEYRRQKRPYGEFYAQLGYTSESDARKDFHRALAESIARQDTAVEVYREEQLIELEYLAEEIHEVFRGEYFVISQAGRLVPHPETGDPLPDPGPRMAAADRLLKIAAQVAKLRGLDAPTKLEGVFTIDALNRALAEARDELAALEAEGGEAGGTGEAAGRD